MQCLERRALSAQIPLQDQGHRVLGFWTLPHVSFKLCLCVTGTECYTGHTPTGLSSAASAVFLALTRERLFQRRGKGLGERNENHLRPH